jgi:OmpA-OmpF porin, OOP family
MKTSPCHLQTHRLHPSLAKALPWGLLLWVWAHCMSVHAQVLINTSIDALSEPFALSFQSVAPSQSRIVFYRPSSVDIPGATTVYVNGRYHASLSAGGYASLCISPGMTELGSRHLDVRRRASRDGFDSITEVNLLASQNHFIRVEAQSATQTLLVPVTLAQAQAELPATRLQTHTISRVIDAVSCQEVPTTEPPPVIMAVDTMRKLALPADTLFGFNRSDREGMTSVGIRAVDQLISQIASDYERVSRLHVVGYADPIGTSQSNQRLSEERAYTVKDYLSQYTGAGFTITHEGRGASELLTTECGSARTPENMACHQPNRRVVVEVTGVLKKR